MAPPNGRVNLRTMLSKNLIKKIKMSPSYYGPRKALDCSRAAIGGEPPPLVRAIEKSADGCRPVSHGPFGTDLASSADRIRDLARVTGQDWDTARESFD